MNRFRRFLASALAAALLVAAASSARAADPYEINVILSLTGPVSFVGTTQMQALKALETQVNRTGGIRGRPVSFVFADDQSSPQTAVQLARGLIAKNIPILMGPSGPASCSAIAPLIGADGPLHYCLANAGNPTPGSYEFLTLFSYESQFAVTLRYFRERGLKKIAYIVATDAGGQAAEKAFLGAMDLPENKSLQIVTRQYFAMSDLNTNAQMARIKASNPDALLAWSTGSAAGTLFRTAHDAGIDLPTVTSPSNLNAAFFKQYGSLLPTNLYFAAVPYYANDAPTTPATKAALATMTSSLAAVGAKPDMIEISAWDPGLLVIDTLRKLGADASAAKLRAYLVNLKGWTGTNGPYDFRADPQRGVGEANIVMVRWDPQRDAGVAVSKLGGAPLRGR